MLYWNNMFLTLFFGFYILLNKEYIFVQVYKFIFTELRQFPKYNKQVKKTLRHSCFVIWKAVKMLGVKAINKATRIARSISQAKSKKLNTLEFETKLLKLQLVYKFPDDNIMVYIVEAGFMKLPDLSLTNCKRSPNLMPLIDCASNLATIIQIERGDFNTRFLIAAVTTITT